MSERIKVEAYIADRQINTIMAASKAKMPGFWIPVIAYRGEMFAEDGIKQISNGHTSFFISGKGEPN